MADEANKCVRIEVEFQDGTILKADEPEWADQVWQWLDSCQLMNCIHGASYKGRPMETLQRASAKSE